MIYVEIKNSSEEAFKKAVLKFKSLCKKDGFIKEINDRRYYTSPSIKLRKKREKAKRARRIK